MTTKISKTIICVFLLIFAEVIAVTAQEAPLPVESPSAGEKPLVESRSGGRFFLGADNVELFRIVEEIRAELGITISGLEGVEDRKVSCSGEWASSDAMVKGVLRFLGIKNYLLEFDQGKIARVRVMNAGGRFAARTKESGTPELSPEDVAVTPEKQEIFSFVKVQGVVEGSQAEELDIMTGDFIVQYNGVEITSSNRLVGEVKKVSPESRVEMVVIRDHDPVTFTLKGGMIGVRIITVKLPMSDVF